MAEDDLISVGAAQAYLCVSRKKMAQLINDGIIPEAGHDPLDGRIKLVRRADVERLKIRSVRKVRAAHAPHEPATRKKVAA